MSDKPKQSSGIQMWISEDNGDEIRKLAEHIKATTTIEVSRTKLANAAVQLGLPELKRKHGVVG